VKVSLCVLGILIGSAAISTSVQAQNYPWCAEYTGTMGGARNCGFSTYDQCMAALSGNGGFCNRNTQYAPGRNAPSSGYGTRRRDHS
jgi:hypothetical protein